MPIPPLGVQPYRIRNWRQVWRLNAAKTKWRKAYRDSADFKPDPTFTTPIMYSHEELIRFLKSKNLKNQQPIGFHVKMTLIDVPGTSGMVQRVQYIWWLKFKDQGDRAFFEFLWHNPSN
jgi:hypothetical protein